MDTWKKILSLLLISVALVAIFVIDEQTPSKRYFSDGGYVFGTTYKIIYEANESLTPHIHAAMMAVDTSLSMFNQKSTIAAINRNDNSIELDSLFVRVFQRSQEISTATGGAFDITVAPLVNLWGFGFNKRSLVTPERIDSALQLVGYQRIKIENGKIVKENPAIMLDASAIAKGFASDVVADTLRHYGVKNYLVEIGGEVVVLGKNSKGNAWRIAINKPVEDSLSVNNEIEQVAVLERGGIATSGNYRNFYIENGKKFAHTIDPKSGYPVQHSLLSATILANDCMTADAYATACMVMGLEKSLEFCAENNLEGYFIYAENGRTKTVKTKNFPISE